MIALFQVKNMCYMLKQKFNKKFSSYDVVFSSLNIKEKYQN